MRSPKHLAIVFALGLGASVAASGSETDNGNDSQQGSPSVGSAERLKKESSQALDALADFTAEQKDKASATASDLVNRLDKRIELLRDDLQANWDQMSESTREERQQAIDELAKQRDQLKEQFRALSKRSGQAWEELKTGFVNSYRALTADESSESQDTGAAK